MAAENPEANQEYSCSCASFCEKFAEGSRGSEVSRKKTRVVRVRTANGSGHKQDAQRDKKHRAGSPYFTLHGTSLEKPQLRGSSGERSLERRDLVIDHEDSESRILHLKLFPENCFRLGLAAAPDSFIHADVRLFDEPGDSKQFQ